MGIKLPKLNSKEIDELAKDLMYIMTYHGDLRECDMSEEEMANYLLWKEEYIKELEG